MRLKAIATLGVFAALTALVAAQAVPGRSASQQGARVSNWPREGPPRPLAAAIDDDVSGDRTVLRDNAGDASVDDIHRRHRTILDNAHAALTCPFGERKRQVAGVDLAIGGQECSAEHVADIHHGPQRLRF